MLSFGRSQKMVPDWQQCKTNLNFYDDKFQKYMYDWPKSMKGLRIPVRFDPDHFLQIWILERALTVLSQWDSEL
jgi:hypothetical protein